MGMDCKTTADLVTRSLSGNATAQDDAQLRSHLAACPACAELQRGLSATWILMGRLPVLTSAAKAPEVAVRRPRFVLLAAAAAAAIMVGALVYLLRPTPPSSPETKAPIAAQTPEESRPEQRREEERVQEVLTHINQDKENEKPEAPAPAGVPPAPENNPVAVPDA